MCGINPSCGPIFVTIVPADVPAPHSAGLSVGTVLT